MPARSTIPLERVTEVCERFYARDGFVKWADVGAALGVSRQAIQLRLTSAVQKGLLPAADLQRWQSMASRAATTRERREAARRERNRHVLRIQLTEDNHAWLLEEARFRGITTADLVNGLLTRERSTQKTAT